ncbi:hypothetical protein ACIQRE_00140 [Streptomyces griseoluteus]
MIEADNTLYWTVEGGHDGFLAPVVLDGPGEPDHQVLTLVH